MNNFLNWKMMKYITSWVSRRYETVFGKYPAIKSISRQNIFPQRSRGWEQTSYLVNCKLFCTKQQTSPSHFFFIFRFLPNVFRIYNNSLLSHFVLFILKYFIFNFLSFSAFILFFHFHFWLNFLLILLLFYFLKFVDACCLRYAAVHNEYGAQRHVCILRRISKQK